MDVKDYLEQVYRLDKRIQFKVNEVCRLKVMATSISSIANDDVRVQTSRGGDKIASAISKIVDLENELSDLVEDYIDTRKMIIKQIEELDSIQEYQVLMERYIERKPWDEIAIDIDRSRKQVDRIHGNALAHFEEKYLKDANCL